MTQNYEVIKETNFKEASDKNRVRGIIHDRNNLRNIIIETSNKCIQEVEISHVNEFKYFNLGQEEEWRIEFLKYLKEERPERPLDLEEEELLKFLCIE